MTAKDSPGLFQKVAAFFRENKYVILVPALLIIIVCLVIMFLTENKGDAPFQYAIF